MFEAAQTEDEPGLKIGLLRIASPNGKYLAICDKTSTNHHYVNIYDCESGKKLGERHGPKMPCMAWSPDSSLLAIGEERGIIVFVKPDGQLQRPGIRRVSSVPPQDVGFSPDGSMLAVAGNETLALYSMKNRQPIWQIAPMSSIRPACPNARLGNCSSRPMAQRLSSHNTVVTTSSTSWRARPILGNCSENVWSPLHSRHFWNHRQTENCSPTELPTIALDCAKSARLSRRSQETRPGTKTLSTVTETSRSTYRPMHRGNVCCVSGPAC
jgi:hypothetical protein